jgi:hypothetical protein
MHTVEIANLYTLFTSQREREGGERERERERERKREREKEERERVRCRISPELLFIFLKGMTVP